MKNYKNVLVVTSEFPPQPGGIGNHAYNLALYLSKSGYQIEVIADQRSKTGETEVDFDKNLPFNVVRIKRYNQRFLMYFIRIYKTYRSIKKVSNVIATGKFSLWNTAFLGMFFKAKKLAVVHGSEVNFKTFLLKKSVDMALNKMDTIIAVSQYTKSLVAHSSSNVFVIPNGINLKEWSVEQSLKTQIKGNPVLTTVGRVSFRKGQLNVIKQLPHLIKQFPELHYHCIGIPGDAEAFMAIAKQLKVESYITFHGCLDDLKLKQILSKTDIFVMLSSESSKGDVEGYGIAILEANALGVPAIGSKGCGIEDAIKPNTSGILINLKDALQFENAINTILQNKTTYSLEARKWAELHDWSNIINRYIDLIS